MHVKIGVPEVCRDQTLELFKGVNGRLDAMMTNSEKKKKLKERWKLFLSASVGTAVPRQEWTHLQDESQ